MNPRLRDAALNGNPAALTVMFDESDSLGVRNFSPLDVGHLFLLKAWPTLASLD